MGISYSFIVLQGALCGNCTYCKSSTSADYWMKKREAFKMAELFSNKRLAKKVVLPSQSAKKDGKAF